MKKHGFTLIELIVVITILAILGTIAFISFNGYSGQTRNAKVTSDLSNLHTGLSLYKAKHGVVPMPDNLKTISSGAIKISYEGEVGSSVRSIAKADNNMVMPDGTNYLYAVNKDQKKFTLIGTKEEVSAYLSNANAEGKEKIFKGDEVLTVFESNGSLPSSDVNIASIGSGQKAYLGEKELTVSSNSVLFNSCKEIKNFGLDSGDKNYSIGINGASKSVYCDMTTDGGGWTMYNKGLKVGDDGTYGLKNISTCDGTIDCSLDITSMDFDSVLNINASKYIAFKGFDKNLFLEELKDTDGETSNSTDAQTVMSLGSVTCDVGNGKKTTNLSKFMFEIHHGDWNPAIMTNYILSESTTRDPGDGIFGGDPKNAIGSGWIYCDGIKESGQDYELYIR